MERKHSLPTAIPHPVLLARPPRSALYGGHIPKNPQEKGAQAGSSLSEVTMGCVYGGWDNPVRTTVELHFLLLNAGCCLDS